MLYPTPIAKLIDSYSSYQVSGLRRLRVWPFIRLGCLMMMSMNLQKISFLLREN